MKRMIYALLCLLASLLSLQASAAPKDCIPGIYGEQVGSLTVSLEEEEGQFFHWYCRTPSGGVAPNGIACVRGSCLPASTFLSQLDSARLTPAAAASAVQAAWDATVAAGQCTESSDARLAALCVKMRTSIRAKWPGGYQTSAPTPPDSGYMVKPNPACTAATGCTRPVFDYVNGVRGTKEVGRAAVRAYCDFLKDSPKVPSTGTDMWLQFGPDYAPNKLTLCSLQKLAP